MKLLILGLLMERDLHPYEIRKIIKSRNWDESFKLRDGSLYYAVDQLRASGHIEPAEVVQVPGEKRPDKVIYHITEKGVAAFQELLIAQFKQISYPQHPVFSGLPFVRYAEPAKVEPFLAEHLEAGRKRIDRLKLVLERKAHYLPRGSTLMIEGFIAFGETECDWIERLLEEAKAGTLFTGPKLTLEEIEAYLQQFPD
ncbi:DNA-binding PadR family transcriptional regulator [Paenibacillus phyllosphaerae]|uniref:DNA-binding PadR family transcriptional regulator n=1 Tax=Paenibacillus phyllosphaerae TaxID=274593 RepID=A0A7W5B2P5_9BACL|nr:PadR family transcriptional regulator [Paenibacillus phyllosphaerae]MBB3113243.1 DNA-binding PadR family transcriptional regulator [Paenibacillus phyllosphaerae]